MACEHPLDFKTLLKRMLTFRDERVVACPVCGQGKVAENSEGEAVYRFYNSLTARLLPRRRPDGVETPCYCAGGHRGDRRTLAALLEPEAPLLKAVFSISRPGGQAGRAGEN